MSAPKNHPLPNGLLNVACKPFIPHPCRETPPALQQILTPTVLTATAVEMSASSFWSLTTAAAAAPFTLNRLAFSARRPVALPPALTCAASLHTSRVNIKCSYTASGAKEDFSVPIDVVADVKTEKVVVLGGSGFVGSAICKAAVNKGIEVISLSRSGRPSYTDSWVDQVTWVPGDVFYARWDEVLVDATAVVSTLGGFGSEDQMKKINGEANILAVNAAKDFGVPKFILISVHDYNLPSFLLSSGYFTGKRQAESEVLLKYPRTGVVLRPGFIYGKRKVDGFEIPLDVVGEPLQKLLLAAENFTKPLASIPASDLFLAPPVSVDDVAYAVISAVGDDDFFGVFTIEQIREAAAKVRT